MIDIKHFYLEKGEGKPFILLHGNGAKRDDLVRQMKDDIRAIKTDDFVLALHRNGERRHNICKYVHESFRDFALSMLRDKSVGFGNGFTAEEAETLIQSVVERLQLPDLSVI